jgi:uncharacterized protein (TIGR02453 family)
MKPAQFSVETLAFIKKAGRQKNPDWLENNREDYERLVRDPLQAFAARLSKELKPVATGYHFPLKGIGRMKRSVNRAAERGGSLFKDWISYTATRPSASRFESNPSIFFMINPDDGEGDEVLLAGGLYMPSSPQMRAIRESVAANASPFEQLFKSKDFRACFPDGFSEERKSSRVPRGFDANHPYLHWIQLQGFFVWKSYRTKKYSSSKFSELVARDARQILRLNALLDLAIAGKWERAGGVAEKVQSLDVSAERGKLKLYQPDF